MQKDRNSDGIGKDKAIGLGLRHENLVLHQNRIRKILHKEISQFIPVLDTCRKDNAGILDSAQLDRWSSEQTVSNVAAFVPAAGAASRYFQPLDFLTGVKDYRESSFRHRADQLLQCPIPKYVRGILSGEILTPDATHLEDALKQPKALQSATTDGTTFFEIKLLEHDAIGIRNEIFITPSAKSNDFISAEKSAGVPGKRTFFEQGPELSTIRFDAASGDPVLVNGSYSIVPAGHGVLAEIFPKIRAQQPELDALFIRNIDNVIGLDRKAISWCQTFIKSHRYLLRAIRSIRERLSACDLEGAEKIARELAQSVHIAPNSGKSSLLALQENLFHSPNVVTEGARENLDRLKQLYNRPLNLVGVVPNTGGDVGGTPVFCDAGYGRQKILLELPHASPQDKERYFVDPKKATHFNPVFVCAELPIQSNPYEVTESPFWILAKKPFAGREVVYHETVLYELLGNSQLANAVFVEIPRILFNPHKTVLDGCGHSDAFWKVSKH
ncbi:MAG: DUF4301 family protein [Oligoflexales bacterium]